MIVSENLSGTNQDKAELEEVLKGQAIQAYQKIYSKTLDKDFKGKAGLQTITPYDDREGRFDSLYPSATSSAELTLKMELSSQLN